MVLRLTKVKKKIFLVTYVENNVLDNWLSTNQNRHGLVATFSIALFKKLTIECPTSITDFGLFPSLYSLRILFMHIWINSEKISWIFIN